jgi:hypothetical protein
MERMEFVVGEKRCGNSTNRWSSKQLFRLYMHYVLYEVYASCCLWHYHRHSLSIRSSAINVYTIAWPKKIFRRNI